jgi:hypothetical protein
MIIYFCIKMDIKRNLLLREKDTGPEGLVIVGFYCIEIYHLNIQNLLTVNVILILCDRHN